MKALHMVFIAVLLTFAFGCGSDSGNQMMEKADNLSFNEDNTSENDVKTIVDERKLIRNAVIRFQTDNPMEINAFIKRITSDNKGYIADETSYKEDERTYYSLQLKIPADKYEYILDKIEKKAGKLDSKEVKVKDVTDEFTDTEVRLKNKRLLEEKYQELLKKTSSISEIMEVERQINTIREEIELVERRFKGLQNKINYSQIDVNFYETKSNELGFGGKLVNSLSNGWENMLSFIILMLNLWPFLLVMLIGLIILVIMIRKRAK